MIQCVKSLYYITYKFPSLRAAIFWLCNNTNKRIVLQQKEKKRLTPLCKYFCNEHLLNKCKIRRCNPAYGTTNIPRLSRRINYIMLGKPRHFLDWIKHIIDNIRCNPDRCHEPVRFLFTGTVLDSSFQRW